MGRVWVFDTNTLGWSHIDPSSEVHIPPGRYLHGCVTSEHPLPQKNPSENASYTAQITSGIAKIPSLVSKGSSPQGPHGSLIICGGLASPEEALADTYTFNILSRAWSPLPSCPAPASSTPPSPPSFALASNRLYLLTHAADLSSATHTLPLSRSTTSDDARGTTELGLTAAAESWTSTPFPTNPLTPGPRPRKGGGLANVTTGNGREYLLYFMGEKASSPATNLEKEADKSAKEEDEVVYLSDVWSYQVPATAMTAAGIKDKTREAMGIATGEGSWAEVKVVAATVEKEGVEEGKAHPGPRGWFAADHVGRGVDGGGVVLWGGRDGRGVEGDGWVVGVGPVR